REAAPERLVLVGPVAGVPGAMPTPAVPDGGLLSRTSGRAWACADGGACPRPARSSWTPRGVLDGGRGHGTRLPLSCSGGGVFVIMSLNLRGAGATLTRRGRSGIDRVS